MRMENRRRFPRKPLYFRVACAAERDPYRHVQGDGFDISAGGVGIKIGRPIENKGPVRLRITRPFYHDTFEVRGVATWQDGPDAKGAFRAGIKFLDMPWNKIQPLLN